MHSLDVNENSKIKVVYFLHCWRTVITENMEYQERVEKLSMMKVKISFLVLVVAMVIQQVTPRYQERSILGEELHDWRLARRGDEPQNAFSNDINKCLFTAWTTASGSKTAVLSGKVSCSKTATRSQLCYGNSQTQALFAVCYNKDTLIPEFTGHIVRRNTQGPNPPGTFEEDTGKYAPKPQAKVSDYDPYQQTQEHSDWNVNQQYFCSKGHLTPNADFALEDDRALTYIITNAAPQWQKFNEHNWAALEKDVRTYTANHREVYVFTGTGGIARDTSGNPYMLNKRVRAPMYYWKVVCDPVAKESIVFVGTNKVGSKSTDKAKGCLNTMQTTQLGIVKCDSFNNIKNSNQYKDFNLPPLHEANCRPSVQGTFMNQYLNNFQ